jgi:hypothetical protein
MYSAAEDDAERARIHAKLYAPPGGAGRRGARRPGRPAGASRPARTAQPPATGEGMSMGHAQTLMAQMAAEDARLAKGR